MRRNHGLSILAESRSTVESSVTSLCACCGTGFRMEMELLRTNSVAAVSTCNGAPGATGWTSVNAGVKLVRTKGLIRHSRPQERSAAEGPEAMVAAQ
jgi:hypothetical protein